MPDQLVNKSVNHGFCFNILCVGECIMHECDFPPFPQAIRPLICFSESHSFPQDAKQFAQCLSCLNSFGPVSGHSNDWDALGSYEIFRNVCIPAIFIFNIPLFINIITIFNIRINVISHLEFLIVILYKFTVSLSAKEQYEMLRIHAFIRVDLIVSIIVIICFCKDLDGGEIPFF